VSRPAIAQPARNRRIYFKIVFLSHPFSHQLLACGQQQASNVLPSGVEAGSCLLLTNEQDVCRRLKTLHRSWNSCTFCSPYVNV
jgi:hypothetical protein